MMRRTALVLISILLFGFANLSNVSIAYGLDGTNTGTFEDGSSYYFIHYNGEEQEIVFNENLTLTLNGWTDESKSSVNAKIDIHTDSSNQTEDVTIRINDELNEIAVKDNESIHYKLAVSDTFKVEEVMPFNLNDQMTVVAEDEQSASVEEVTTMENSTEKVDQANVISTFNTQEAVDKPSVHYATHVQGIGWLNTVANGEMSGTQGQAKRLESIKISVDHSQDLGVKYSTHVQKHGWMDYVSDGEESGTTGEAKRLEAIKIELTGGNAENFDIYYRVHAQSYGWLGWAKNGEAAGTEGLAKRLEAIEIVLVEKGREAPGSTDKPFITKPSIVYSTHVQTYGWMNFVADGAMSGTHGQAKRLEAIKIDLQDTSFTGDIIYSTHVQGYGWLNNVSNGALSGTFGQSKRLEAIKIELTGDIANYYDVYYRVHIQGNGWLGWAKNGMHAGSEGLSKRLEGIEIKLVPKGQGESVSVKQAFKQPLTVFLDPGHGGSDPGAIAGGYHEADLNLFVAKKVQSLLVARGYKVYMSRTNNTYVSLLDRPQMANDLNADIFVSIHTNSTGGSSTTAAGIESYYYEYDADYPSKINSVMHNNPDRILKSVTLTNLIHKNMVAYTGANNRGTDGDTFAVVRETAMPATLLEMGFINNSSERQKLVTDSYQNKLAKAIADGIDAYFKIY